MENLPKGLAASAAVKMQAKLESISGGKVLDVATESGGFIDTLMKVLKDYDSFVGIDLSKKGLDSAEKRFRGQPVKLMEMNAESLDFSDDSFDTVCMAYSLHHLERISKVLAEMHRVLKPGGSLIIQEEFCDGKQTEAQKTNILQHAWDAQIDSSMGETHKTTFTKYAIKGIIRNLPLERLELLESTHPVECLFCEKKFRCENPESKEEIDRSLKEIGDGLKRLKEVAGPEARIRLQKMGEELKERNRKFGNAHPSVLLAIGRKVIRPHMHSACISVCSKKGERGIVGSLI
ncbi:MAG: methyltransferase domain-containing protein [Candidatus Bathyarchaeota archaeon]|nr:MAG: methyltransferase domain-containing protein [Candidatus Bathyarchaeota archaeon]